MPQPAEDNATPIRRQALTLATAIPLAAAVYVASGSLIAGLAVAIADFSLRPVVRTIARRWS